MSKVKWSVQSVSSSFHGFSLNLVDLIQMIGLGSLQMSSKIGKQGKSGRTGADMECHSHKVRLIIMCILLLDMSVTTGNEDEDDGEGTHSKWAVLGYDVDDYPQLPERSIDAPL